MPTADAPNIPHTATFDYGFMVRKKYLNEKRMTAARVRIEKH